MACQRVAYSPSRSPSRSSAVRARRRPAAHGRPGGRSTCSSRGARSSSAAATWFRSSSCSCRCCCWAPARSCRSSRWRIGAARDGSRTSSAAAPTAIAGSRRVGDSWFCDRPGARPGSPRPGGRSLDTSQTSTLLALRGPGRSSTSHGRMVRNALLDGLPVPRRCGPFAGTDRVELILSPIAFVAALVAVQRAARAAAASPRSCGCSSVFSQRALGALQRRPRAAAAPTAAR